MAGEVCSHQTAFAGQKVRFKGSSRSKALKNRYVVIRPPEEETEGANYL